MSEEHVNDSSTQEQSSEPNPQPSPKRLYRSRQDRICGGVCGGLGEYFGIDPVIFRIAFAVTTVTIGFGLLAYIVAWIVLPERERQPGAVVRRDPETSRRLGFFGGIGLVLFGLWLLIEEMGFFHRHRYFYDFDLLDPEVIIPLAIIGFGAYLLFGKNGGSKRSLDASAADAGEPSAPSAPKFTRSRTDRKVAGVCGGIANHFNIDPTWVRLGAVFLILLTKALGLLAYFILAIVVPEEPEVVTAPESSEGEATQRKPILLLVVVPKVE